MSERDARDTNDPRDVAPTYCVQYTYQTPTGQPETTHTKPNDRAGAERLARLLRESNQCVGPLLLLETRVLDAYPPTRAHLLADVVPSAPPAPNEHEIIVTVSDGMVRTVYSTLVAPVEIVDYDNIQAGDPHPYGSDAEFEEHCATLHQLY